MITSPAVGRRPAKNAIALLTPGLAVTRGPPRVPPCVGQPGRCHVLDTPRLPQEGSRRGLSNVGKPVAPGGTPNTAVVRGPARQSNVDVPGCTTQYQHLGGDCQGGRQPAVKQEGQPTASCPGADAHIEVPGRTHDRVVMIAGHLRATLRSWLSTKTGNRWPAVPLLSPE